MKGNRLTIPTLRTGEWCDKDEVMLHAAFTLLVDFVEKEWEGLDERRKFLEENSGEGQDEMTQYWVSHALPEFLEIESLYNWWKHERVIPWEARDWREEERLHTIDTENLCRLARLRRSLWT